MTPARAVSESSIELRIAKPKVDKLCKIPKIQSGPKFRLKFEAGRWFSKNTKTDWVALFFRLPYVPCVDPFPANFHQTSAKSNVISDMITLPYYYYDNFAGTWNLSGNGSPNKRFLVAAAPPNFSVRRLGVEPAPASWEGLGGGELPSKVN